MVDTETEFPTWEEANDFYQVLLTIQAKNVRMFPRFKDGKQVHVVAAEKHSGRR